ncbi:MAG: hypothetical protein ABIQ64_01490 [Candidatus Saccharimonadales bacterium]
MRHKSGRILGAHQKIDRVARKRLSEILPAGRQFPSALQILHFEGMNGPDGVKRKSPAKDEPWHYIDPTNHNDTALLTVIDDHIANLTQALVDDNNERAAFEAAWLAHAIVDGLTPAHHYPLSDKIEELWGHPKEERTTIKSKNIIPGDTRRDQVSKNWQYWGAKGVFMTHILFEFGFATTISALRFKGLVPNNNMLVRVNREGPQAIIREAIWSVYELDMYTEFAKSGWTRRLARLTRTKLAPIIIRTVIIAWYYASERAEQKRAKATA